MHLPDKVCLKLKNHEIYIYNFSPIDTRWGRVCWNDELTELDELDELDEFDELDRFDKVHDLDELNVIHE